jgi:hypothetical protein
MGYTRMHVKGMHARIMKELTDYIRRIDGMEKQ